MYSRSTQKKKKIPNRMEEAPNKYRKAKLVQHKIHKYSNQKNVSKHAK